jgi:hypothetical protein
MLKTSLRALALFVLGTVALTTTPKPAEAAHCFPCVWHESCTGENAVYACWFSCANSVPVGCGVSCGEGKFLLGCGTIWS